MEHEQTAGGTAVGGDDRGLNPELIGRAGFALADALGLGGMEGIEFPAALALLLGADLVGTRERGFERRRDVLLAGDLAADVADQPAEPGAQDAQLPTMAVELFGVGIAPRHHRRAFGDAQVGLPQPHAVLAGQPVQSEDDILVGGDMDSFGCRPPFTVVQQERPLGVSQLQRVEQVGELPFRIALKEPGECLQRARAVRQIFIRLFQGEFDIIQLSPRLRIPAGAGALIACTERAEPPGTSGIAVMNARNL